MLALFSMKSMTGWLLAIAMLLAPTAGHEGVIAGQVKHSKTGEPVANALVILQCTCLAGAREAQTDADGNYAFRGLPAGVYTVQVLAGQADVTKVVELPPARPVPKR
jgi:Carboxypeptidase regulatory-like domain